MFNHIIHTLAIFLFGGITFLNLSWLKYGVPVHYNGSWYKVIGFTIMAILVFIISIPTNKKEKENE